MKKVIMCLVCFMVFFITSSVFGFDISIGEGNGRYQAIATGSDRSEIFVIDTKEGHFWSVVCDSNSGSRTMTRVFYGGHLTTKMEKGKKDILVNKNYSLKRIGFEKEK